MASRNSSLSRPRSASTASNRPTSASQTLLTDHCIRRITIGERAALGTFYDARTECVVGQLSLEKGLIIKTTQYKPTDCIIIKSDLFDSNDFFRKIEIHEEPWLNCILNIAPAEGITTMINYSFPKNKNIRFFYFHHLSEEQLIIPEQNTARKAFANVMPGITTTHVISAIKLGIQNFIVLQLPSHDEIKLDDLLENKAQQLTNTKFQISKNEKSLLDRITVLEVFSNIPSLKKTSTIADIYQKIADIKPHNYRHYPLEYTLRTIKWFYPLYPKQKAQYIPLESNNVNMLKQYLISLSSQINELKILSDSEDRNNEKECLNEQYKVLKQHIIDVEQMYSAEIERIRVLVIKIRRGAVQQELLTTMLTKTSEKSLQTSINSIVRRMHALKKEEQLISQTDQENTKYSNVQERFTEENNDLRITSTQLCSKSESQLESSAIDDLKNQNSSTENDQSKTWIEKSVRSSTLSNSSKYEKKVAQQPSSPTMMSKIENRNPSKRRHNSVDILPSRKVASASQPIPRERKQSTQTENLFNSSNSMETPTTEHIPLSGKEINTSKSSIPPPVSPRTIHGASNPKNPCISSAPIQSSKQTSLLREQPDHSIIHDTVSKSSQKLVLDATQPPKGRLKSVNSLPSLNEQPHKMEETQQRPRSATSSVTKRVSFANKHSIIEDEQLKSTRSLTQSASDVSFKMNHQNEHKNESSNLSISSEKSDIEKISPRIENCNSLEDTIDQSRPSTAQSLLSTESYEPSKAENIINSSNSFNESSTNNENELNNTSNEPKILTPRAARQKNKELPKILVTDENSSSKVLLNGTSDQLSSSKSLPILPSEPTQQIEKQSNQLKSVESLSTKDTSSLKQQSDVQQSPKESTSTSTPRQRRSASRSRSSTVNYINILLLGESGVGKSTFINALVNYHAFETFEQAYSSKPLVVMPVSFLLTEGDYFEEKTVRFGGIDPNEDHEHPGQSVTQYCRSYVFPLGSQTKLRIIDTPGMGDTRGLDQDDINMQHILSFINNLPHLNAICILLKPNESRLNIVLRSYFTRLLNFLGENARNNIVFCFTNTRATFFGPGNTGPLLKKMIKTVSIKDIPFAKINTFCFDSESFRYLVALQNGVEFDEYQQNEYRQSWIASVTESTRFLQYISEKLTPYSQNDWQSIEHANFKIKQMVRPMLETIRNHIRNITLLKETSSKLLIKLYPTVISEPSAICYACTRSPKRFSDFLILPDDLHGFSNKCNQCDCSRKKHTDVNYKLEYKVFQYEDTQYFAQIKSNINQLRLVMLEFGQFYVHIRDSSRQNDPFLYALKRIIAEEKHMSSTFDKARLNLTLYNVFTALKKDYEEVRTNLDNIQAPIDLSNVYEQMKNISKINEINEQMNATKQAQDIYLKQQEKQIS